MYCLWTDFDNAPAARSFLENPSSDRGVALTRMESGGVSLSSVAGNNDPMNTNLIWRCQGLTGVRFPTTIEGPKWEGWLLKTISRCSVSLDLCCRVPMARGGRCTNPVVHCHWIAENEFWHFSQARDRDHSFVQLPYWETAIIIWTSFATSSIYARCVHSPECQTSARPFQPDAGRRHSSFQHLHCGIFSQLSA